MSSYKIRRIDDGRFSHGVVTHRRPFVFGSAGEIRHDVKWSSKGKVWNTEKAVKSHLTIALQFGLPIAQWEIVEVVLLPTKPMDEWIDAKMLLKVLKK